MKKSVVLFCVFALVLALVGCSSTPEHVLTYERGELSTTEINGEDVPSIYIYIPKHLYPKPCCFGGNPDGHLGHEKKEDPSPTPQWDLCRNASFRKA